MRRAAAVGLALVLAGGALGACSGGDDSEGVALEDNTTTTGDSGTDTTSDGSDVSLPDNFDFGNENCTELVAAVSGLAGAFTGSDSEQATLDFGAFADALDQFADSAPDDIRDDLGTLSDAYRQIDDELGGPLDLSDPEVFTSPEFAQIGEQFNSEEFTQANENVTSFIESECTTG
jgi:hypothetical protein